MAVSCVFTVMPWVFCVVGLTTVRLAASCCRSNSPWPSEEAVLGPARRVAPLLLIVKVVEPFPLLKAVSSVFTITPWA